MKEHDEFDGPMIRIEGVDRFYSLGSNQIRALKGIDLNIERNEFIAIMGPSGSGKSTLMNILGCLHKPSAGKYFLEGNDIMVLGDHQLAWIRNRKIGFIFQSFNLLQRISAFKNIELPLIYGGCSKIKRTYLAQSAIEMVGLKERMHHRPYELSGGQQQRVAIARALVTDPVILLADEPTGNLDCKTGKEIMQLFEELHAKGKTIILITHDDAIAHYADRMIRIKDGRIVSDVKYR